MKIFKLLGSFACAIGLILFSVFFVGCKPRLETIYIVPDTLPNIAQQNSEFLYPNLKVKAKFSDKTEKELDLADLKITSINTQILGEQTFQVEYLGKVATQKVVVKKILDSIAVKGGIKNKVYRFEQFNVNNAIICATYQDNSTEDIPYSLSSGIVFGDIDTETAGNKILQINYGGKQTTFNYSVIDINSIEYVSGLDDEIFIDDKIDVNNFVIQINYADETSKKIGYSLNSGISVKGIDTTTSGEKTLKIFYHDIFTDLKNYTVIEDVVISAKIKEGTVKNSVVANSILDTSKLVLTLTYKSGKTKDVLSGFIIEPFNTSIVGEYNLIVTYGSLDPITKTISVTNDFIITGFEKPQFVGVYETNSKTKNTFVKTNSTGVKGFEITESLYLVGNDNEFIFRPTLSIYKNGENQEINKFKTKIKVFLQNDEKIFEELTENLTKYVQIDDFEQTYKFLDLAVNKTFKISVRPYFVSSDEEELVDDCEFMFKVVKGYNVYNQHDLSLLDNVNENNKWTKLKSDNNIDINKEIHGIVLQNDISITSNYIPEIHFYTKAEVLGDIDFDRAEGSLKDSDDGAIGFIYKRQLIDNETFNFEGNYYKISAEKLPLIVREKGNVSTSSDATLTTHTALFGIFGSNTENKGLFNFNNVSFVGNSKKSEDATKSGGVICFKATRVNFNFYNCLSQGWFINTFLNEAENVECRIEKSNIFDANNTLLYCWGADNVKIIDSHMIGAGGPVMICDHIKHDSSGNGGTETNIETINSVLESYVAGTENWFQAYHAVTLAGNIKAMNEFFKPYGKTILDNKGDKFNLITVYKSGKIEGLSNVKIKGTFKDSTLEDENAIYENGQDLSSSSIETIKNQIISDMAGAGMDSGTIASACEKMAILQTANGTVGVPGDKGWLITPNEQKILSAKTYMFIYLFNGMGATLGFSNTAG